MLLLSLRSLGGRNGSNSSSRQHNVSVVSKGQLSFCVPGSIIDPGIIMPKGCMGTDQIRVSPGRTAGRTAALEFRKAPTAACLPGCLGHQQGKVECCATYRVHVRLVQPVAAPLPWRVSLRGQQLPAGLQAAVRSITLLFTQALMVLHTAPSLVCTGSLTQGHQEDQIAHGC